MNPWTLEDMQTALLELAGLDDDDREQAAVRAHLLDIASDHFHRYGYRRANVGDIARAAGISKGALYLHFDSKLTLLVACIAREKLPLVAKMEQIFALPPHEQLGAYIHASLDFVVHSPLTQATMRGDPELARALASRPSAKPDRDRGIALIEQFIERGAPDMPADLRRQHAEVLAAVLGLPAHLFDHPVIALELDDDTFVRLYADLLTRGVLGTR